MFIFVGFVQKTMLRRTRIFLMLVAVVLVTIWHLHRLYTRNEAKILAVMFYFVANRQWTDRPVRDANGWSNFTPAVSL